jgi:hypothetical protein
MSIPVPIVKKLHLDATVDHAFEAYTDGMSAWWPVETHAVSGVGSIVELDAEGCFETAPDGSISEWGSVVVWEAPDHIRHTWHPGAPKEPHTLVDITFRADGDGTAVVLTHSGWAEAGASLSDRDDYDTGWDYVLGCYFAYATFSP